MEQVTVVPVVVIPQTDVLCEGCGKPLDAITLAMCGSGPKVCTPCVKARQRAAVARKCCCGKQRRENPEVHRMGSRRWHTCFRCLGTTRQLS